MKWYRIVLWYLRPRVIKNYFKYIVLKGRKWRRKRNCVEDMKKEMKSSSTTNTDFSVQTSGIADFVWYGQEDEKNE